MNGSIFIHKVHRIIRRIKQNKTVRLSGVCVRVGTPVHKTEQAEAVESTICWFIHSRSIIAVTVQRKHNINKGLWAIALVLSTGTDTGLWAILLSLRVQEHDTDTTDIDLHQDED